MVVGPGAFVDVGVCGVVAAAEYEGGDDKVSVDDDVAVATLYVASQKFIAGIAITPLIRIAACNHELAGNSKDLLHLRHVR